MFELRRDDTCPNPVCALICPTLEVRECAYCGLLGCQFCVVEHHGLDACETCAAPVTPTSKFTGSSSMGAPTWADSELSRAAYRFRGKMPQ